MYDPDRFARNLSHQPLVTEEIEKANVRLEFVTSRTSSRTRWWPGRRSSSCTRSFASSRPRSAR
ncbi:MAG: hypothetical protein M0Z66_10745 [Thermaerobacter sp.]|nr:hypothetical protein [Thermaerobacter sp.]